MIILIHGVGIPDGVYARAIGVLSSLTVTFHSMDKSFSNGIRGEVLANQHFSPADLKTLNHQAVIHYGKRESRWFTSFTPLPDKMSFCQPSRYAV